MTDQVIINVYCVSCKSKQDTNLKEIQSGTRKNKIFNMAKGVCIVCEKNTCMLLSQKMADEYNLKLKDIK